MGGRLAVVRKEERGDRRRDGRAEGQGEEGEEEELSSNT